jgi:Tfp pilus assembly protein PilF
VGLGRKVALVAALAIAACATAPPSDQRPMYGGEDRGADPVLSAEDEKLVADAVKAFGDARGASNAFCSDGDAALRAGDSARAMQLYNRAWLVDKNNPAVYWGFAGVLYGRDEFCESSRMLDQGAARGAMPPRVMPSAAMVYAGCGITLAKVTEADSGTAGRYFARAEDLLTKAAADPAVSQREVVATWARYYYGRGQYKEAWVMVAQYRKSSAPRWIRPSSRACATSRPSRAVAQRFSSAASSRRNAARSARVETRSARSRCRS